jgi:cephalosporin hydroxylase
MKNVGKSLFKKSPYDGFDFARIPADMQGWGSDHRFFAELIGKVRPTTIIEVGTWKGRSAIGMAKLVKKFGLDCEIVCVDTWLGSPEHWLNEQAGWHDALRIHHGLPHLYWVFLANVMHEGCADIITPLPNTSQNAAAILARLKVRAEFCYIDAAHEYAEVLADLRAYWPLLEPGGYLMGDDYIGWPGVTRAADEFAAEMGCELVGERGKFFIRKA